MNNPGREALRQLVESDDSLEELSEYLDGGGDPNQNIHESDTLLHVAAQSEGMNERIVQKLIDAGANIDSTSRQGHTPLQLAVISRNLGAIQALIQAGANINIRNFFGRTALHYAIDSSHLSRRYFHPIPDLTIWPYWLHTPTMEIIMMLLLVHDNIEINPVDLEGETPLMWAVRLGYADVVKTLLNRGANPSISNHRGQNCLHVALAAHKPNDYIITEFLQNGTCIYDADNLGRTPVDILLGIYLNKSPIEFLKYFLEIIAFKYRIRKDLECKVRKNPVLFEHLKKACQEVQWMKKQIIHGKMTLHDFASECFQNPRTEDAEAITLEICNIVVAILLSGRYEVYLERILNLISKPDLCTTLESIVRPSFYFQYLMNILIHSYRQNHEIFPLVQKHYQEQLRNDEHPVTL